MVCFKKQCCFFQASKRKTKKSRKRDGCLGVYGWEVKPPGSRAAFSDLLNWFGVHTYCVWWELFLHSPLQTMPASARKISKATKKTFQLVVAEL